MTHTPASGPRAPVTIPPMSSLSTATEALPVGACPAVTSTNDAMNIPANVSATVRQPRCIDVITPSSSAVSNVRVCPELYGLPRASLAPREEGVKTRAGSARRTGTDLLDRSNPDHVHVDHVGAIVLRCGVRSA